MNSKPLSPLFEHRKAFYEYHILHTLEAGVRLKGWEVKALRSGHLKLSGSWVGIKEGRAVWHSEIMPLAHAQVEGPALASRELLLKRAQILFLIQQSQVKGLTVIPLKAYFKNGWFKIELGVGRGKKHWDKRESEKLKTVLNDSKITLKTHIKRSQTPV